jgi:hypothetical protein
MQSCRAGAHYHQADPAGHNVQVGPQLGDRGSPKLDMDEVAELPTLFRSQVPTRERWRIVRAVGLQFGQPPFTAGLVRQLTVGKMRLPVECRRASDLLHAS